jgi:hypothetical protein
MQLQPLQQRLQDIYEIDNDYDVETFLISDASLATHLENRSVTRTIPEKLLVRQHPDGIDVSLYLQQELLQNLASDNPIEVLHTGNFADFCTVTEGVSHFVYLTWNAHHERSITLFELELQAEVDKFILAAALLAEQSGGSLPHNLAQVLFDKPRYDPRLNHQEQQRYRLANVFARRYCQQLHQMLREHGDAVMITRELRRFYRLLHHRKIQRITRSLHYH